MENEEGKCQILKLKNYIGYAKAYILWNMQHLVAVHTQLLSTRGLNLLHVKPLHVCYICYPQVLHQWKLSQSLPQLPKVRVQEDRLILQTTRNEGDWYKHWAWHCIYCMCTWEPFVQNFRYVHSCAHSCSVMFCDDCFYSRQINFPLLQCFNSPIFSRETQCSYFSPLSGILNDKCSTRKGGNYIML